MKDKDNQVKSKRHKLLDQLIGMPKLLNFPQIKTLEENFPKPFISHLARTELQNLRIQILNGSEPELDKLSIDNEKLAVKIAEKVQQRMAPSVAPAINATGIILHTALGRAPLCEAAQTAVKNAIKNYDTIAIDRESGKRGDRYAHVEDLLCYLTGAEAACVVNNNSGATMLALNSMAEKKEVIVSRGQLVEIGGSFRIPDVMMRSQAEMVEVGTTNKTHLRDYEGAITEETALLLRVHTSNYQIIGFSSEVPLNELIALGNKSNIPVMDDIGSGCLVDFKKYGLPEEPMVQDSLKTGADVICFSGDKILCGPQCGIIIGKKKYIDKIKKNPLARALRCGKLTYAALEATLKLYLDEETLVENLPVLRMLTMPLDKLNRKAAAFRRRIKNDLEGKCLVKTVNGFSQLGSGSLPAKDIPTKLVSLQPAGMSAEILATKLRQQNPPIFSRIDQNSVLFDFRTIADDEIKTVENALRNIFQ